MSESQTLKTMVHETGDYRIHFGRVVVENRKAKIKPIDNDQQSEDKLIILYEEDARKIPKNVCREKRATSIWSAPGPQRL